MPVFDFFFWNQQSGNLLEKDGAIIQVEIGTPKALEEWIVKKQLQVPPPIPGYALIDTGASISSVHQEVLDQLSILPIDSIPLCTPSGEDRAFIYPTKVSFPGLGVSEYQMSRVAGSQLNWTTSQGNQIIMLLGRDLLSQMLFIYNGKTGAVTISY